MTNLVINKHVSHETTRVSPRLCSCFKDDFIQVSHLGQQIESSPCVITLGHFNRENFSSNDMALWFPNTDFYKTWGKKRQQDFLAGRLCAAVAVSSLAQENILNIAEMEPAQLQPIKIGTSPCGKPSWEDGLYGSISHSGEFALAMTLASPHPCRVGVDIEFTVNEKQAEGIARYILSNQERVCVEESELSFELAITLVFSAKESLFKALSEPGDNLSFTLARLVAIDVDNRQLLFTPNHKRLQADANKLLRVSYDLISHLRPGVAERLAVATFHLS
ncbi:4'-phosphopantetheinyl transferase superfamily protein [Shewanella psychrophila]|uniref:Enterobactin synthase component D n=1 Tax=Shewanella psychrophila TaxID=225848 RepID=A0A1S6HIT8_9GAMM|nr:4'-phosphopantetheinyl transferase superfamily protein [Shewanella psychrophila]AQS35432.1 4'-phosphopantetheinyl transferase superfamily protein [Shewanella psychrophila]